MPNLILKCTKNVKQLVDLKIVFAELHRLVVATLDNAKLDVCVSYFIPIERFYMADGKDKRRAHVSLSIDVYAGRQQQQRTALAAHCLLYLTDTYAATAGKKRLDIFVEVRDMEREACAETVATAARSCPTCSSLT